MAGRFDQANGGRELILFALQKGQYIPVEFLCLFDDHKVTRVGVKEEL